MKEKKKSIINQYISEGQKEEVLNVWNIKQKITSWQIQLARYILLKDLQEKDETMKVKDTENRNQYGRQRL